MVTRDREVREGSIYRRAARGGGSFVVMQEFCANCGGGLHESLRGMKLQRTTHMHTHVHTNECM